MAKSNLDWDEEFDFQRNQRDDLLELLNDIEKLETNLKADAESESLLTDASSESVASTGEDKNFYG